MAWQDMQQTMRLLTALGQMQKGSGAWTKGGAKKGTQKGKSQGKGWEKEVVDKDECFQCHWSGCVAAEQQWQTHGHKGSCHKCNRPKGIALNPPLGRLVQWAFDVQLKGQAKQAAPAGSKASKGKGGGKGKGPSKPSGEPTDKDVEELRKKRLAALKDAAPQSDGQEKAKPSAQDAKEVTDMTPKVQGGSQPTASPSSSTNEEEEARPARERWQPRDLPCETIDAMNTFQESFQEVADSLSLDLFPTEEGITSAEMVVKDLLADNEASESTLAFAKLQEEVTTLKGQLAMGTPGSPADVALKEVLAKQTAALARAEKKKPWTAVLSQSLVRAKEDWELGLKQDQQRAATGADKAHARKSTRLEQVQVLEQNLQAIKDAIIYHDLTYEEHHKERSMKIEKRNHEVERLLAAQIVTTKNKEKAGASETAKVEATVANDQLTDLKKELETSRQKQLDLLEKMRLLQGASAATSGASASQAPDASMLFLSADDTNDAADPSLIPDATAEITQPQLAACGHLYQLLILWSQGGCQPVTFGELKAHSKAGADTPELLQCLLGKVLWDGWFDIITLPIEDAEVVPRQALAYVSIAIEKLKAKYDAVEQTRTEAVKAFALMTAAAKKRKTAA